MITLKQLNDHIKCTYPTFDIELVKGDGYFYFSGNDAFDNMPSIFIPTLNCCDTDDETRTLWHRKIDEAYREAGLHIKHELQNVERVVKYMLEMKEKDCDDHAADFADNPMHFFEWNVVSAWANFIMRDELRFLKSALDESDANGHDDRRKLQNALHVILSFAIKRAERKLESSTYNAREAHSFANQEAYARLCATFGNVHRYARDNEPTIYDDYLQRVDRAVTRGY